MKFREVKMMNRRYMRFLTDQYRVPALFFFVIYAAAVIINMMFDGSFEVSPGFYIASVLSIAAAFIIPLPLFSFVHRRKSSDMYGSVPFTRMTQLVSNIVYGFTISFGPYLVTWLILLWPAKRAHISTGTLVNSLPEMALICLTLVMFNAALFLIGNNMLDGIIILAGYTLMPLALFAALGSFYTNMLPTDSTPNFLTVSYFSPILMSTESVTWFESTGFSINILIAMLCFIVISILLLRKQFLKRDMERAEQLSNAVPAYPLLIPAYALIVLTTSFMASRFGGIGMLLMAILIVFVAYSIGQFVYRRTVRPNRTMLIGFAVCLAVAGAFTCAAWQTHGFGIGDRKPSANAARYIYSYDFYAKENDLSVEEDADEDPVNVSFSMTVPKNKTDEAAAVTAEKFRRRLVKQYYSSFFDESNDTVYMSTFSVKALPGGVKNDANSEIYNMPYSFCRHGLSVSELKTIDEYTKVKVTVDGEGDNSKTYTLDEYLKLIEE